MKRPSAQSLSSPRLCASSESSSGREARKNIISRPALSGLEPRSRRGFEPAFGQKPFSSAPLRLKRVFERARDRKEYHLTPGPVGP